MTTLKEYALHQLREIKREMLTALENLSQEDLVAHEGGGGHSPVGWIVQHCMVNVDLFIHKGITGEFSADHEQKFLAWPLIEPKPGESYPPLSELKAKWAKLMDDSIAALAAVSEERLQQPSRIGRPPEPLVESCLRVINHQNSHLRQIWCIIGWRRIEHKWPDQQTWLA